MFDILAIMGRGIQMLDPKSDPTRATSYDLTEDLEICDERSRHLPVHLPIRIPADDENPHCMVGGGRLNLLAGIELTLDYNPVLVVCAYGHRSNYLKHVGGPTESEVMSAELADIFRALPYNPPTHREIEIVAWPRTHSLPIPSNTRQELLNIFDLALERRFTQIAIVTVGVHVPRIATYVAKHLSVYNEYRTLSPVIFESEAVLLRADYEKYKGRVERLRNSRAFTRNWGREADGISKIVRDVYGDAKPKAATE